MTVPSITGSITTIQSNASSGSQNITVPADATFALVLTAFWESGVPDYSTLTLNSVGFTKVVENASDGQECSNIYRLVNPTTGADIPFAWSWASAPDEGAHIFVVFVRDVNTSAPITGSGTGASTADPVTDAFNSTINDLCIGIGSAYGATAGDAGVSGQTEVADGGNYNSVYGVVGTKPGVSGTTTMTIDFTGTGMQNSICACSVAGSVGGTNVTVDCLPGIATLRGNAASLATATASIAGQMRGLYGFGEIASVVATGGVTLTQEGFRWRNNDGDEDAATWAAAQDANHTVDNLTPVRLRVLADASGDTDPAAYRLEYRKVGDTEWLVVE